MVGLVPVSSDVTAGNSGKCFFEFPAGWTGSVCLSECGIRSLLKGRLTPLVSLRFSGQSYLGDTFDVLSGLIRDFPQTVE